MLTPINPLPEPLRASDAGTFTEDSVVRRLPEIAETALANNDLDAGHLQLLEQLIEEINHGVITELEEPFTDDAPAWEEYVTPYLGMTWLDVPWFFAETYFYRRLLAATGYWQPGPGQGLDPFASNKQKDLDAGVHLAGRLAQLLGDLPILLSASLWANRVDRSLWPAGDQAAAARTAEILGLDRSQRLLVDDTERAVELLPGNGGSIHIILDNSGAELVADLVLVAQLLDQGDRVTIHAKPHPTFVSDVTLPDLEKTISRLGNEPDPTSAVAQTLTRARASGALAVTTHPFWVSPLPFWKCPSDLVDDLSAADIVIVKGDANYRRLLGDLHWEPTTPIEEIVRPLQPIVALRTSKSLVAAGLSPDTVSSAANADRDWMSSGEWGMIQFIPEIP
jgi:hypothetical protein